MKKLKSNLFVILFFFVVFLYTAIVTFSTEFTCSDEVWNFQNVYKMYNGGLIYRDNNVIITPLFFLIGNMLFHLLNANLFTFRIYGVMIYLIKFILIFLIFKNFKIKKFLSILYISIWLIIEQSYIPCSANYNQLALVGCLIGILCYIFKLGKKSYDFIQGFLIFFIFFTKQTTGIYYAFGIVLFELIENGFDKNFWIRQFTKLSTFLPCTIISCLILHFKGNFIDFINLCFGSLLEFGNSNFFIEWKNLKHILLIGFLTAFAIFCIKLKNIPNPIKINIKFLLCLALANTFNILPLPNEYHINMAMLFYYIMFIYIINSLLIGEIFTTKQHKIISTLISFVILFFLFIKVGYFYFTDYIYLERFEKTSPFYNSSIGSEDKEKISQITNYIQAKKSEGIQVIVLSYEAASFMVPLNINNGVFDLPNSGNFGYQGISKVIEQISTMQNTEFLIFTNEKDCFYQESKEIREYIMNNLEKKGEFLEYSIYINN